MFQYLHVQACLFSMQFISTRFFGYLDKATLLLLSSCRGQVDDYVYTMLLICQGMLKLRESETKKTLRMDKSVFNQYLATLVSLRKDRQVVREDPVCQMVLLDIATHVCKSRKASFYQERGIYDPKTLVSLDSVQNVQVCSFSTFINQFHLNTLAFLPPGVCPRSDYTEQTLLDVLPQRPRPPIDPDRFDMTVLGHKEFQNLINVSNQRPKDV